MEEYDDEQRSQVLEFATGCGRVPAGGFTALNGYGDSNAQFTLMILPYSANNRLCLGSACFNTLKIREYPSEDELRENLLQSIQGCRTFAEGVGMSPSIRTLSPSPQLVRTGPAPELVSEDEDEEEAPETTADAAAGMPAVEEDEDKDEDEHEN